MQRLTRIKELNGKLSTPASATVEICISHLAILYNAATNIVPTGQSVNFTTVHTPGSGSIPNPQVFWYGNVTAR